MAAPGWQPDDSTRVLVIMKMSLRLLIPFFLPLLFGCVGGGPPAEPDILWEGPWARPMPLIQGTDDTATNSAVYMTLRNQGKVADRLLGGHTPAAAGVEVHRSRLVGDVMRMERLEGLDLPPGSAVELAPGGVHLMLLGISRSLEVGGELELTLSFQRSQDLVLTVPVGKPGG